MGDFEVRLAPSAERTLERLPESVAAAVAEFVTGPLLEEPFRVGRPQPNHAGSPANGSTISRDSIRRPAWRSSVYRAVHPASSALARIRES